EREQLEDVAKPLTVDDAEESSDAESSSDDDGPVEVQRSRPDEAGERSDEEQARQDASSRTRDRIQRHREWEREGMRRYRPGPGRFSGSPGMAVSTPLPPQLLEKEVEAIANALRDNGPTDRRTLVRMVGARSWGPGAFGRAVRQ